MTNVYVKKLLGQESGYSGDTPGQRGKYLLVSSQDWPFFPVLSSGVRNSFCSLNLYVPSDATIAVLYVWHNTKYFPESGLQRKHNERRIYRNRTLDESLNLDRDTFILFFRLNSNASDYKVSSVIPGSAAYALLENAISNKTSGYISLETLKEIDRHSYDFFSATLSTKEELSVKNPQEILDKAREILERQSRTLQHLGERVEINDDPLIGLSSTFRTQSDFSNAVRDIYNNVCAVRGSCIYDEYPIGLEAAHIHAKYNGGNFLPTNGLLLSTDLHRAFDEGIWTLSDNLEVVVHSRVKGGLMQEFVGKKIVIPAENQFFKPHKSYIHWHRENRFGSFERLFRAPNLVDGR